MKTVPTNREKLLQQCLAEALRLLNQADLHMPKGAKTDVWRLRVDDLNNRAAR